MFFLHGISNSSHDVFGRGYMVLDVKVILQWKDVQELMYLKSLVNVTELS